MLEPSQPTPSTRDDHSDLSLSGARTEDLVDFRHVEVRVGTADLPTVRVTLRFEGVTSWTLHEGPSWAAATCHEVAPGSVSCDVMSARGPLGFDLVAPSGFAVDAVVSAPGDRDPRPDNDRVSLRG